MNIVLIVAYARGGVIGRGNTIPWHIKGEQAHFKRMTLGHPIIMGRKTWASLPKRPLPQRRNIVVSRQADLNAPGAEAVTSLESALALCAPTDRVFVIGGAQIYNQALGYATEIIATEIDADIAGDVHFPKIDTTQWRETSRNQGPTDEGQLPHAFVTYQRVTHA